ASRPAPDQQATGSGAQRNFKKRASSSHVPRQSGGYPRGPNSTDQLPLPLLVLPPLPFLVLPDDSRFMPIDEVSAAAFRNERRFRAFLLWSARPQFQSLIAVQVTHARDGSEVMRLDENARS